MGTALFYVGVVLVAAWFGYFIFNLVKFIKVHEVGGSNKIEGPTRTKFLVLTLGQGLFVIISSIGFVLMKKWELNVGEYIQLILGSLLFGSAVSFTVGAHNIYHHKEDLDATQRHYCKIFAIIGAVTAVIGAVLLTNGFAYHVDKIAKGIGIHGWVYPGVHESGFNVKFYGIVIIFGALIALSIGDYYVAKKYGKHNLLDSLFVFALLMGILGARLWYCLVLEGDHYLAHPADILKINEGGLAIQGGAMLGIIAGVAFLLIFRRYMSIRYILDIAVPAILIAQAMGRWGNFFNQEVYGKVVSEGALWFLPNIVKVNMYINGAYRVPLFFIEAVINVCGYFVIRYVCGKALKMHAGLGYQASMYLIWYGLVRVALEPLREGFTLEFGSSEAYGYMQSWITAFAMVGAGILVCLGFFIYHKIRMNKNLEDKYGEKI